MKKKNIKNVLIGLLEVLLGIILLAAAVWLFSKAWGTSLLYTDSVIGRVVKYYWVFLIAAAVMLILGTITIKKRDDVKEETVASKQEGEKTKVVEVIPNAAKVEALKATKEVVESGDTEMEKSVEVTLPKEDIKQREPQPTMHEETQKECPKCHTLVSINNKFCTNCGYELKK